ncbi:MAG: serine/threonine protein phosphatase [Acidobacteria bacterium]|nr:MAG: serine/threonine protein phosphatase [Acidobacteriota bacterium]
MSPPNPNLIEKSQQEELLAVMVEIGREINAILSLDELLEKIAQLTRQFIDYQIFAILLVDDQDQTLFFRFTIGYPDSIRGKRVKFGEGLVGAAAQRREPILVADVSKDPRYINVVDEVRSELAIPLISRNRVVGVLDIESPQSGYFQPHHQKVLTLLASQLAVAIDNANLYENLVAKSEMLETLHDIGKELSSILDLEQLLKKVAELLGRVFHYHIFSIMLVDEEDQTLKARMSVKYNRDAIDRAKIPLGKGLVGSAVTKKRPLRINDVSKDPRYINLIPETKSEMVVPLIYKDNLQSPFLNYFTLFHEQALMTLASHVAVAIENARLYERVVAAEARLDRELKFASEIQYSLITDKFPEIPGISLWAEFRPARILGGDLYDFYKYEDDQVAIAVGDVSGKGAPAALYGALASGILRTRATRKYPPAEMLRLVNVSLRQRTIEGRFMTLCYATYDAKTRILKFSNSGAPPPILCKQGTAEVLSVEGFPLGMFDAAEYQEREIVIEPGDCLIFYTDGLVEARDLRGEEFGFERLKEVLEKNSQLEAKKVIEKVFAQIERFSLDSRKFDDQTIVALKAVDAQSRTEKLSC